MWEGDLSVLPPFSCLDFPFLKRSREMQYFRLGKSPDIISPNLGENLFSIFEVQAKARKGLREGDHSEFGKQISCFGASTLTLVVCPLHSYSHQRVVKS